MKIIYARVSTVDQKLALQDDALTTAGCKVIHDDKLSGVSCNRPDLTAASRESVDWKQCRVDASSYH